MPENAGSTPLPMNGPLLKLGKKLRAAVPPSLNILIDRFDEFESYDDFVKLVKEYVPEHEQEILRLPSPETQIVAFASHFEDKYFPLHYSFAEAEMHEIEGYSDLTRGIPLIISGLSYDDIDMLPSDGNSSQQLMSFLIPMPENQEGIHVALGEACLEYVPKELLERLPQGGFPGDELHRLLDGTRFKGLAVWADIVNSDTGNYFLDADYDMFYSSGPPDWDMENVQALTTLWQQSEAAWGEVNTLAAWLEEDKPAHFEELLDFIERRRNIVDSEGMPEV
ncbi:MAG: hypothetical protein HYX84_02575 [Chloroflexi bacterium]|nr:hypothetical protein [Chloroflexota bacterium]